jgi:hypothetical protein
MKNKKQNENKKIGEIKEGENDTDTQLNLFHLTDCG